MGQKQSSPSPPPPPPVVKEADFPGSGSKSSIIPGKPETPRTQGVSISESQSCKQCDLEFVPGISTSTVSLTRQFGSVRTCSKFDTDLQKVKNKQMAVRDFVGGIQGGQYLRPLSDGFCEEVRFPDDIVPKIATINDLNDNLGKLTSVRIRQISSEGFSADTKAFVKPSIPFKLAFNGTDISVNTITIYHPFPLRVQDQQSDAVISLNDPSEGDQSYIILIPITTGNPSTPSAGFFGKIANQLTNVELPNLATGQYTSTDIQTGKNWGLSDLFPITAVANGKAKVDAGFFVWEGLPPFEKFLDKSNSSSSVTQYAWRRKSGVKPVTYIMLEKPLPVSPNDLATLIRTVPVTDWKDAIHEVFSAGKGVVYKQGPPTACNVPVRETMENQLSAQTSALGSALSEEIGCDPFSAINVPDKGFSTNKILTLVFNVLLLIAAAIGAYLALAAVARMYDVEYTDFTKGIGKVIGVYAKNLQGKIGKIGSVLSAARAGPAGLAGLAGLPQGIPTNSAGITSALQGLPTSSSAALQGLPTSSSAALQGLPTSSAGITNALRDVAPISVAPGASSVRVANELPASFAALTDSAKEAPASFAALQDSGKEEPRRTLRSISPGIASRMKNYTSTASVTPTGQATRGLFNTARTFGRARPDHDRGGLTRRARR